MGCVGTTLRRGSSTAPALSGVTLVLTRGLSISCWIEPGMLSPSSGAEFWSPPMTNLEPGFRPPNVPASS
jgi:hypothetical protein